MKILILGLLLIGCGDHDEPRVDPGPELCVKPKATYIETFGHVYGGCPGLPAVLITITDDGTFPIDTNEACTTTTVDDCKAENTGCVYESDGCVITSSLTAVFKEDGTGTGYMTVDAKCGSNCMGIYQLYFIKQ